MGVQARVVLWAADADEARAGAEAAFARLHAVEIALSDWDPESELSRLVVRAGEGPVPVGEDLAAALELAGRIVAASGGAFDPSVAPVVRLWREARRTGVLPEASTLEAARRRVGWERVVLGGQPVGRRRTVALAPGTELDLGGIGKGFGADRALEVLRRRGLGRALVEVGGDLALGAPPPGRAGWVVAVGCRPPRERLVLANAGVASSGPTEQHLEVDGVRYSHLVDPRTGLGTTDGRCVGVVAPSGALADGLASAAAAVPEAEAAGLVRRFGARLVGGE